MIVEAILPGLGVGLDEALLAKAKHEIRDLARGLPIRQGGSMALGG